MHRRKADRARVLAEIVQAQRYRFVDQDTEDPTAARKLTDRPMRFRVDAGRQEALELSAAGIDDAERGVSGARQVGRSRDETLQERLEGKLGRDRHARLEKR